MSQKLILTSLIALGAAVSSASESPDDARATAIEHPRYLMIALDAVPYGVMRRVSDPAQGEVAAFAGFTGPVPLISTFPSTTSLALGGMLAAFGLDKSAGYEHRFYDLERGRKRGGGPISYRKLKFPWRKFYHWQQEGVVSKGLKLLHLQKSARKAVEESVAAFAASDERIFHLYHDLTDLIGHVKGPGALEPFLRHLDLSLRGLRDRPGARPFHTVIYSDHGLSGGEPLGNVRKAVKKALRRGGWHVAGRVRDDRDVVFIPYGLVSSFVVFTAPGRQVEVAEALASAGGIDLCVAAAGAGQWLVASARGSARVLRRAGAGGDLYAYRPLTGDPFGYAEPKDRSMPATDWQPDAWWLETTRAAAYPDALYRITQGFELVENPASVICSVAEGHMYGAAYTVLGSRISTGKLRWTHGSMAREPSLGFVMSDEPGWQASDAARFDRALLHWGER